MLDLIKAAQQLSTLDPAVIKMGWDIVGREGGYVNNPNDSGGATNYGVSLKHARANGLAFDIDHDGDVDEDDIRMITPEIAVVDFLVCFFLDPKLDMLPACIQPCAFDHAVNGGAGAAVRLVQTAINALGIAPRIAQDGALGPATAAAAKQAVLRVGETKFVNALVAARIAEYQAIVARLPKNAIFLKGWTNRANSFRK